jgi:hypothetical protein
MHQADRFHLEGDDRRPSAGWAGDSNSGRGIGNCPFKVNFKLNGTISYHEFMRPGSRFFREGLWDRKMQPFTAEFQLSISPVSVRNVSSSLTPIETETMSSPERKQVMAMAQDYPQNRDSSRKPFGRLHRSA